MPHILMMIIDILRDDVLVPWFAQEDLVSMLLDAEVGSRSDIEKAVQILREAGEITIRTNTDGQVEVALANTPKHSV